MPRLGISIDQFVEHKAPPSDKYGRRIRHVEGVQRTEPSRLFDPILVKIAGGLALVAALSLTIALWRLFAFAH